MGRGDGVVVGYGTVVDAVTVWAQDAGDGWDGGYSARKEDKYDYGKCPECPDAYRSDLGLRGSESPRYDPIS
jgi:hypothetical protein